MRAPVSCRAAVVSAVGYRTVDPTPTIHRGLPSPSLTFVLSLDDQPIVTGWSPEQASSDRAHRDLAVVGGLHTSPAYIAQPVTQLGIQLAIRPLATRALFGVPASELDPLANGGEDVLGSSLRRLREQLIELPNWTRRFEALTSFVRSRLADAPERNQPRPEVTEAWRWIARHRGTGSIAGLARHVALSPRQLNSVFRAELGMGPKSVASLMRFEHARQLLSELVRTGARLDIATIAHAAGFYDHSHLVRDFQRYTGQSPSVWLAETRRIIQAGGQQVGEDWTS